LDASVVVGFLQCCRIARVVNALDFKHMIVGTLCCPRMSPLLLDASVVIGFLPCCRIARVVSALDFNRWLLGPCVVLGCLCYCWTPLLLQDFSLVVGLHAW